MAAQRFRNVLKYCGLAFNRFHASESGKKVSKIAVCSFFTTSGLWWLHKHGYIMTLVAPKLPSVAALDVERKEEDYYTSSKEDRFRSFASCEYDGQIYMTMQDFLESITEENPRPRIGRFKLRGEQVVNMLNNTPPRKKGSKNFFRSVLGRGIISYTEYLFLLCILTKPKGGFQVAFKMFDRDGNQRVDKKEFLLMEEIFRMKSERSVDDSSSSQKSTKSHALNTSTSLVIQYRESKMHDFVVQETTLLRYFFGSKGRETLDFNTFCQFMDNLQTEVLELEFMEFSKGMPTISEGDFAQVLLRYTQIDEDEKQSYFARVKDKIRHETGISFDEFRNFFQFLNNLDDFEIVMKMYTFADQSISQAEFERAVQVTTGHQLAPHLVDTVFQIFDKDGDGKLSQKEFIGVMKNRIHRGFREHLKSPVGWSGFKACVKHEIKYSV